MNSLTLKNVWVGKKLKVLCGAMCHHSWCNIRKYLYLSFPQMISVNFINTNNLITHKSDMFWNLSNCFHKANERNVVTTENSFGSILSQLVSKNITHRLFPLMSFHGFLYIISLCESPFLSLSWRIAVVIHPLTPVTGLNSLKVETFPPLSILVVTLIQDGQQHLQIEGGFFKVSICSGRDMATILMILVQPAIHDGWSHV